MWTKKLKISLLALMMGTACLVYPAIVYPVDAAADLMSVGDIHSGIKEADFIQILLRNGWTPVEGAEGNLYEDKSSKAKDAKSFDSYASYETENGVVKQVNLIWKNGNKGAAEKKFKQLSSDLEKQVGHWTNDGMIEGDGIMACKYNMWSVPEVGIVVKISWSRDNKSSFHGSSTTETVTYMLANY